MKKLLVTGATSQIGKFLLPLLVKNGYFVVALSRKEHKNEPMVQWIKCDIENLDFNNINHMNISDIKAVIHLAEIILVNDVVKNMTNINRVIAFSSTSAITKINSNNEKDRQLAFSLQEGENNFISFCEKKLINWSIFRPTLVYGANMDKNITFIMNFIKKYHFFPILGKGDGLRQPVHAYDLALACLNSIENKKTYNKTYNLTGGETLSYYNMVEKIFIFLNKRKRTIKIPKFLFSMTVNIIKIIPRYNHLTTGMIDRLSQNLCFDISQAKKDFGYNPHNFVLDKELINDV